MTSFDNLTAVQKLQARIHRDVKQICTETCHLMGLDITKAATEIIAELVFKKLPVYGADLEAFAKHAKRQTILTDDVKLLVRRNPSLLSHITALSMSNNMKEKRRKTVAPPKQLEVFPSTNPPHKPQEDNMSVAVQPPRSNDGQEANNMSIDDMVDLTFD